MTHSQQPRLVCAPGSPFQTILDTLPRIAKTRAPVLVTGESGTGKEGVVRALHDLAAWSDMPLVAINCGAVPRELMESELFGHVRGAFTGADRPRVGLIEAAKGGTLFLDEIGEMALDLQVKLLRVLQERVFVPVGGTATKRADFRVVAATNQDLEVAISEGTFRRDLYFRLDVVRVRLPPLRERRMDVAPLAQHFITKYAEACGSRVDGVTDAAMRLLKAHDWPGNVRELENTIYSAVVLRDRGHIDVDDVADKLGHRPAPPPPNTNLRTIRLPTDGLELRALMRDLEGQMIDAALVRADGNKAKAASLLGLNRTTLVEKLKRRPAAQQLPAVRGTTASSSLGEEASCRTP